MSIRSITLLELIEQAWIKTVFEEFLKRKQLWWIERDIVDTLFYFLRPAIELIPQYELFSEWYVKLTDTKSGNTKIDLAVVEPVYTKERITEALIRVAIEIKWVIMSDLSKKRIIKDAETLTKIRLNGGRDSKRGDVICRGNKPDFAVLLLFYDDEVVDEANQFFNQVETNYPNIKVIWSFPNKRI